MCGGTTRCWNPSFALRKFHDESSHECIDDFLKQNSQLCSQEHLVFFEWHEVRLNLTSCDRACHFAVIVEFVDLGLSPRSFLQLCFNYRLSWSDQLRSLYVRASG